MTEEEMRIELEKPAKFTYLPEGTDLVAMTFIHHRRVNKLLIILSLALVAVTTTNLLMIWKFSLLQGVLLR